MCSLNKIISTTYMEVIKSSAVEFWFLAIFFFSCWLAFRMTSVTYLRNGCSVLAGVTSVAIKNTRSAFLCCCWSLGCVNGTAVLFCIHFLFKPKFKIVATVSLYPLYSTWFSTCPMNACQLRESQFSCQSTLTLYSTPRVCGTSGGWSKKLQLF